MMRLLKGSGIFVLAVLGLVLVLNLNSLDDGVLYLQDMLTYAPSPPKPLQADGPFGFCNQFVSLRNAQRARFIENYLEARGIRVQRLPIALPDGTATSFDNLLVTFGTQGPYTVYSAHYDKLFDEPEYQGASDNSAAVCMLLVAAAELNGRQLPRSVAFLFTGEEEIGLVGAQAFYKYATENKMQVAQVLNFDSMGRAGIAARASGERSGFVFTLPLLGEYVYDGRVLVPALAYRQPDAGLLSQLQGIVPLAYFDRMVAKSDGTYFQDHGWNAINFTSDDIYYLDITWHTYGDRVELLDQENLERGVDLMVGFAESAP